MEHDKEKEEALEYLATHPVATLATVGEDGRPQLAAVYVFVDPDFTCYFLTKSESRKFKNIEARRFVSLLSSSEDRLMSVEIEGDAQQVQDTVEVVQVTDRFRNMIDTRKGDYWQPPVAQLQSGQYVVCKIVPAQVHIHIFADTIEDTTGARHVTLYI